MGTKPHSVAFVPEHVYHALAEPRFGPLLQHHCLENAIRALNLGGNTYTTCYWEQSLSEQMETGIAKPNVKYIVTIDYDSAWSPSDLVNCMRS